MKIIVISSIHNDEWSCVEIFTNSNNGRICLDYLDRNFKKFGQRPNLQKTKKKQEELNIVSVLFI